MRQIFILFFLIVFCNNFFAQTRDTSWQNLKDIETEYYSLKVPKSWIDLGKLGDLVDQSFDATSLYFVDSFNKSPIIAGFFVMNAPSDDLEDAKTKCLKGYKENRERIFPKDFVEGQQKLTLQSGQEAFLLNTRFFRPSRQLNQSRFDLVVFSNKANRGFLVTVSVQYKDDSYLFEKTNHLEDFAKKLYSYFKLK
jgi:uracil-DNA glycosylase